MARRSRTDGAKGTQEIVSGAMMAPIDPPESVALNDAEMKVWRDMFMSKARRSWTKADLYSLADLCQARVERETLKRSLEALDPIDDLMAYEKMTKLIDITVKRCRLLQVYLQIHPEATQGKAREQTKTNELHNGAVSREDDDDGLLASPAH